MRDSLLQMGRIAALESPGAKPFRLTATFSTFDYKGNPAGEGTLEETWLRPGVAHRVITFHGLRSDQTAKDGSVRETHEGFTGSFMERRVIAALLDAVPEAAMLPDDAHLDYRDYKVGASKLDCIIVKPATPVKAGMAEDPVTVYCSDPASHVLRLRQERYDFAVIYNKLVRLGEHEIAEHVTISQNGKPRASLTVTSFAASPDLTEKDFVLPGNTADLSQADIEVPAEVIASIALKKVPPVYPQVAKENHISGTVLLSAIISKEGTVRELDVMRSPSPDLTESAMNAVRQWRYKPYLVGGAPTEVNTTITVNYAFNR